MGEVWVAAAATVVGAGISAYSANKKAKQEREDNKAMTEEDYRRTAQEVGYEAALENFYKQDERYEKQRGLDEFRKFSTVNNFSPGYTDAASRVSKPVAPDYNSFAPVIPGEEEIIGPDGKKTKKSTLEKIDPLGAKLIKADPISRKLLGGLF